MSIFTLMSIFTALPSGALAQRFGAKMMMLVACGIAVAGSLLGVAAQTSIVLIASRAVEGVALTVLTTCGPILVQQCVRPEKTGTAMGIWGIWGCVGSTVAAVATPTVFEALGFSGLWIAFAVVCVLAALLVAAAVHVPAASPRTKVSESGDVGVRAPEGACAKDEGDTSADALSAPPRYREIFTRDVVLFFIGFSVFNICLLAILAFVPTILQAQGFDATLSGLISTAPMLLSIVSSPLFGVLSDRLGRCKPLLLSAMAVMGPCTFLLYTQTGVLLWVAVFVMGLVGMGGVGMFLSGYTKLLARPQLASIGMGVMICVQGIGQFLGTFLVQLLLGPALDSCLFAGAWLCVLGLAGTVAIGLCRMR